MFETMECPKCKGSGLAGNDPCDTCGGEGRVVHVRVLSTFDVMLPASSAGHSEPEVTREGLSAQAREHFVGTGNGSAVLVHANTIDNVAPSKPAASLSFETSLGPTYDEKLDRRRKWAALQEINERANTMTVNRELWMQTQALSKKRGETLESVLAAVRAYVDDADEDRSETFDAMVAALARACPHGQ